MRSLRTLHVENGMNSLGGPIQVAYLMQGLEDRGHEAYLVSPTGSSLSKQVSGAGLKVVPISLRTDLDATFILKLHQVIRRIKPDVVHLHSRRGADIMGGIAARMAHAPAVILSRRIDNPVKPGLFSKLKYGPLCDHVISISNGVTDALVSGGIDPAKISLVRSVVDAKVYDVQPKPEIREQLGVPEGVPLIGIAAQLIERKGHRFIFEAMPSILEQFPSTILVVLGEGRLLPKLENHVKALGIEQNVVFAGFRNDMPYVLRELDVLVHPATMEGLGISVLQAMASSVPVVASAVGGLPESVHDGVNGILIQSGDVQALGDAVIKLMSSPELRQSMGAAGRRIVEEEFSVDSMVEGVLAVYRKVLKIEEPAAHAVR